MRFVLLAAFLAGCAGVTPATAPGSVWRMHTEHLAEDRARARACLAAAQSTCLSVIQDACRPGEDARGPASARLCDWRAIAAWEDEMNASLAALRDQLGGRDLENLERSQRAWNASMLADVGTAMDLYEGGSLAGPVGAHVRAIATAQRARTLAELQQMLE